MYQYFCVSGNRSHAETLKLQYWMSSQHRYHGKCDHEGVITSTSNFLCLLFHFNKVIRSAPGALVYYARRAFMRAKVLRACQRISGNFLRQYIMSLPEKPALGLSDPEIQKLGTSEYWR